MLKELQSVLADLYEIEPPCNVEEFLVTDPSRIQPLLGMQQRRNIQEQLLVSEHDDTALITLFIDASVLQTVQSHRDSGAITRDCLNAYCLAVEGISHFLYTTWRAHHGRCVTQLELELQAEIDKYLYLSRLLTGENSAYLHRLHKMIFEESELHDDLTDIEIDRYTTANRYAAKYCNIFNADVVNNGLQPTHINELRRFYRMTQNEKLRRIDKLN